MVWDLCPTAAEVCHPDTLHSVKHPVSYCTLSAASSTAQNAITQHFSYLGPFCRSAITITYGASRLESGSCDGVIDSVPNL